MTCHRLKSNARPAPWWHRLYCTRCRDARAVDSLMAFGVQQLREDRSDSGLMQRVGERLDVNALGHATRRMAWRIGLRKMQRRATKFAAFALAFGGYSYYISLTPPLNIPPRHFPQPNAYDYFRKAVTQIVGLEPKTNKTSTREIDAHAAHPNISISHVKNASEYSDAQKRELLALNAPALATMRTGLRYPYSEVYVRSVNTLFPHYASYREMARLLAIEARIKASEGDMNAAVNDCLDAMEMGQKSTCGGPLIGELVGIACQAIGRQPLWKLIPKLDATQAKAALQRMQTIETAHVPFVDVMQEEHWFGQTGLHDLLRQPFWRFDEYNTTFGNFSGESGEPGLGQRLVTGMYLMAYSNQHIWNNYTRYCDESIARARMPYQEAITQPEMPEPDDPICRVLFPIFAQAQFKDVQSETQNALLLTTLALRAYAAENHGQYPSTLVALVPGYLNAVPQDLFARHAPLYYKINDDGTYRLYSVGPDGKDDGGTAIDNATRPSRTQKEQKNWTDPKSYARFMTMPDSIGDIVAGATDQPNPAASKN